jgi:hypothetical protein
MANGELQVAIAGCGLAIRGWRVANIPADFLSWNFVEL